MTCVELALLVDRIRFCSRFMMTRHQRAYRRISRAPSHLNFKRHSQRMPPKKPPTTSDGKTPSVAMFFKPVPRPGRPAKCAHARGRPCRPSTLDAIMIAGGAAPASGPPPLTVAAAAAAAEHASSGQPPPPAAAASAEPMGKRKRANYDVPGPARDKLDAAIELWQHGERPPGIATGNGSLSTSSLSRRSCPHQCSEGDSRSSKPAPPCRVQKSREAASGALRAQRAAVMAAASKAASFFSFCFFRFSGSQRAN